MLYGAQFPFANDAENADDRGDLLMTRRPVAVNDVTSLGAAATGSASTADATATAASKGNKLLLFPSIDGRLLL